MLAGRKKKEGIPKSCPEGKAPVPWWRLSEF
jgi:hypothetical protein